MKNYIRFVLRYILIPLGTLFCFTNALMLFMNSTGESVGSLTVMLLALQIVFSALIIIFANTEKKAVSLYVGSLYLAWAFMNIIVYAADDYGIIEFWPCFVLIAGILLIVAGCYKYKKLKFGFVIPSVTLIGMGLWYMLFSFNIIKKSFLTVAATLGPAFMLLIAVFFVILFLAQQKHKELVFNEEDTGVFEDEDIQINKTDE